MPLEYVWLAPAIFTAIVFTIAAYVSFEDEIKSHPALRLISLFIYCVALVFSLTSWLVWALLV